MIRHKEFIFLPLAVGCIVFVGIFVLIQKVKWEKEYSTVSRTCQDDADCTCVSRSGTFDACGKPGQSWKCVNQKCELGFFDNQKQENIIYEKKEGWGPCPVEGACYTDTLVYESGKIVVVSAAATTTLILSPDVIVALKNTIRQTKILDKECATVIPVMDYWAETTIQLDGKEKVISTIQCREEMTAIEKLIPKPNNSSPDS